ncbi:MAG: methyltransferase [Clostridia bacterium]|nr:methyltransferase [Clostridia bacterium]
MELEKDERLEDLMIDGLKIIQNVNLYRFTSDAVLLSRFAPKVGGKVADLCSGSGIVGIHYYALNKGVSVDEYELQKDLAELCEKSIEYNGIGDHIKSYNIPVQEIPSEKYGTYSLVLCNPPYKKVNSGEKNPQDHIALCRHEIAVTLSEIIGVAYKLLGHGGRFCLCQRVERLTEIIVGMKQRGLEPCRIAFVTAGKDKKPYLVLVEGAKGVKPQLKVLPSIEN